MLINLPLYAGSNGDGPNECRALIDALRFRAEHIEQTGFAENTGDAAPTLAQLLSVSLLINEGFLDLSETLDAYAESDGKGGYHNVYKVALDETPVGVAPATDVPTEETTDNKAGEGRGV